MTDYTGGTLDYGYSLSGSISKFATRDPLLDQQFDGYLSYNYRIRPDWSPGEGGTHYFDITTNSLYYDYSIAGNLLSSPIKSATVIEYSYGIKGRLVRSTPGFFGFTSDVPEVKWSEIGSLDFEISKTNIAGNMQLGWDGFICKILQLGTQVIVYGSHGITALVPAKHGGYGKFPISKIGVMNPWLVDGSHSVHFFVNSNYEFCKLTKDGLQMLGYQEFMYYIAETGIITIDGQNELVYICNDEGYGYIYSIIDDCMSEGPDNVTGTFHIGLIGSGTTYVGSGIIDWPDFELQTDILDFGSRKYKTIHQVEVGFQSGCGGGAPGVPPVIPQGVFGAASNSSEFTLEVTIYGRSGAYNEVWIDSLTVPIGDDGVADCRMFGREFAINLSRSDETDPIEDCFDIDWIRIRGIIHDYDPRDT